MKTPIELGEIVKAARQAAKLEISELSVRTGLPEKYLLALERGAHEELPGRAYARIYYLNYARALNLDHEGLMQSWPQPVPKVEPAPVRASRKRGRMFVWLGIPIVAVAVWGIFRGGAPVSVPNDEKADLVSPETPTAADYGVAQGEDTVPASSALALVADSALTGPPFDAPAFVKKAPVRHHLRLVARATSSVMVEADGVVMKERILAGGEVLNAEATTEFVLTVLEPGKIEATLDGTPLVLPDRGIRPLVDFKIPLQDLEGGP